LIAMQYRKFAVLGALAALSAVSGYFSVAQQANSPASATSPGAQADRTVQPSLAPFRLTSTTREVVVEVVARDQHNRPVSDLAEGEFQIFEVGKRSKKSPQTILALHVVDPAAAKNLPGTPSAGFHVTAGGGCAIATTFHYEIVFPASSDSGYHEILVSTTRPHVTLSFRHRYYVGETVAPNTPRPRTNTSAVDAALRQAACFDSTTPSSITLLAHLVQTASTDTARYSLLIQADSLGFIAVSDQTRRVQLDYGVCTFDSSGLALKYLHTTVERVLSAEEYERAQEHGLPNLLEIPETGAPAFARFVVRDRATGNLGSIDVVNPLPKPVEAVSQRHAKIPLGSIRAFGSVVPSPASFCGDVYELPEATSGLPDFWNMDPIGSLYVSSLNVPNQDITETTGIPGVTSRVDWFGIDYHGEFRIATPGEYEFKLSSDDGAELYIDDDLVIDLDGAHPILTKRGRIRLSAGRHIIHVAYFQGPPVSLALVLEIKPPAANKFKVLDLRDFTPSGENKGQ
jgi:hypothetical protein